MMSKLAEYIKNHKSLYDRPELNTLPLVINGYGGPGSGKSTTCLHLVAELKKLGYNAEYVSEYAKELVYEENYELLDGKVEHQAAILLEQNRRVERLVKNVDFIVSDSPILLSEIYVKERNTMFDKCVDELNSHYPAFSFFVERDNERFQKEGRIHNFEESKAKDREIKELLKNKDIYFGTYNHKTIDKIIPNCIKTWARINRERVLFDNF